MRQVLERCAALDVHKAQVTVWVRVPDGRGGREDLRARYSTMTADLLALRDWLKELGVTHVAMESSGVYWKPVYYVLEDEFELLLVNAQHVKNLPGRKTDMKDAEWLCQLLECGLLRGSFVPPREIRELRDLTRYRKSLISERQRQANRLHKVLEGNCQMLWIGGNEVSQAATFSSVIPSSWLSSSVTRMPSLNLAPSSTSATRWCPLNRRQRSWAVASSL
jgi:transposase